LEQLFGRIREIPAWGTLLHDGRTTQSRSVAPRRLSTPKLPEIPEIRADPWSAASPHQKNNKPTTGRLYKANSAPPHEEFRQTRGITTATLPACPAQSYASAGPRCPATTMRSP